MTSKLEPSTTVPPARPSRTARRLLALLLVGAVAAGGWWIWQARFSTYHYATVQNGVLYRDGNQSLMRFKHAIRSSGTKTVACLIDDREMSNPARPQFKQEVDWLVANNVKLERIPVKLGGWPSSADVQRFLNIVSDKSSQPVLVHCAQGVRRTGMMVAAYQESVLGYDKAKAKNAILTFGHSARTVGDVERFIDLYDPQTRTIDSASLPQGDEQ